MAAYVAALFGVGLLQRRSFLSGLKTQEAGEAQLNRHVLLPLILLRHIHHLPHITMSWPSILDRHEAFSTVV
jgi:hypothetical protein